MIPWNSPKDIAPSPLEEWHLGFSQRCHHLNCFLCSCRGNQRENEDRQTQNLGVVWKRRCWEKHFQRPPGSCPGGGWKHTGGTLGKTGRGSCLRAHDGAWRNASLDWVESASLNLVPAQTRKHITVKQWKEVFHWVLQLWKWMAGVHFSELADDLLR